MPTGDSIFQAEPVSPNSQTVLVFEFAIFEKYANMKPYEMSSILTFVQQSRAIEIDLKVSFAILQNYN